MKNNFTSFAQAAGDGGEDATLSKLKAYEGFRLATTNISL
jgi:hypothetical protein